MKTFWERFLDEIERKRDAGEMDDEKAQRWIKEMKEHLGAYREEHPDAPIVQMPVSH